MRCAAVLSTLGAARTTIMRIIDAAAHLLGGRGVMRGEDAGHLYPDIRSLQIYEGATEMQKLTIGREVLDSSRRRSR